MEKTMKAAVLHAPGDLRVEQVPVPADLGAEEVLVKVMYCGICGSDLDRVLKTGTYHFPTILGHEFCGEVAAAPAGSAYKPGDRVVVAPILPCYTCDSCQQGNYGQCDNYSYLGSRTDGGFTEYVRAPQQNLIPYPMDLDMAHGALVEPAAVTLHGVLRAGIRAGDTVAVLGCGPIGLFAVRFAVLLGATRIIATDLEPEKLEKAGLLGATDLVNSGEGDAAEAIAALTAGKGVDVVLETAGVTVTQIQSVAICRNQGTVVYLGTAHRDISFPAAVFERIVRKELNLTGSWNSFSAPFPGREWRAVIDYIANGSLPMQEYISHTIPLSTLGAMLEQMASRSILYNKVIVDMAL